MSEIQEYPKPKTHGLAFNYSLWTPGTIVTLCTVPWGSDYRDIVRFENLTALDHYLDTKTGPRIVINGMTYARPGEGVRLEIPQNALYQYNYIRVHNPQMPVNGDQVKVFYYFINDTRMLAPNTTELSLQLDVWQTFGYGITMGNCYIERGHIGIANEKAFDNFGRDYLAIPEGLDIGSEYVIEQSHRKKIGSARDSFTAGGDVIHNTPDILVISANDFEGDVGTADDPKRRTATGSKMNNLPNGANIYLFNSVQFAKFTTAFADKPHIMAGILSIMAVPPSNPFDYPVEQITINGDIVASKFTEGSPERTVTPLPPTIDWRNKVNLGRYHRLKKMLTFPYCVIELTSYTGTPLVLKPEAWNDADGSVVTVPYLAPPNPRIMFYPYRYNAGGTAPELDANGVVHDGGEFLDLATGIMNLPTFSVVNDGYMMFLASNSNQIAFQHSSADWSQQKALSGAATAYGQATSGMDASKAQNSIANDAARRQTVQANETAGYNALISGAGGLLGAGRRGDGLGAIAGAAGTAAGYVAQTNQNSMSTAIATGASGASNAAELRNRAYNRDTNQDYAQFAAKGDYANTIAGVQARVQDAKMIQPTTAGQIGGDAFLLANFQWGYDFKIKLMGGAARKQVGEFWLRYGYKVEQFAKMPANFMVMNNFTYWELKETYITGAQCPETYKQTIRGIFEKGVTVWSDPNKIGFIDIADNVPLDGVVL